MKVGIPKGTRDFGPVEMARRNYIFNTITEVFQLYGFHEIQTPAQENLSTLMGKYGEEGDKLLFKILNSGDFSRGVSTQDYEEMSAPALASKFCEKGLRYDLTVPFARFVVQHREELQMPFRRYQIQPVWRADRPQKGRYREFYQCDADVIGSDALINEFELIQMIDEVFRRLKVRVAIKLNNRKILTGIAEVIGEPEKVVDITVAIDKLDKIGLDNVKAELVERGLTDESIEKLQPILEMKGDNRQKINTLRTVLASSETGLKGVDETETILNYLDVTPTTAEVELDLTLARGLNYYTGAILEVKALDVEIGSITGGGRYDNLTGVFGMPGLTGVGISFGADRIYDVLNALELYPENSLNGTKILFVSFDANDFNYCVPLVQQLRQNGINAEIYPSPTKMKKQMSYADAHHIPYVAIVGENERTNGTVMLKNMTSGEQKEVKGTDLCETLKN